MLFALAPALALAHDLQRHVMEPAMTGMPVGRPTSDERKTVPWLPLRLHKPSFLTVTGLVHCNEKSAAIIAQLPVAGLRLAVNRRLRLQPSRPSALPL